MNLRRIFGKRQYTYSLIFKKELTYNETVFGTFFHYFRIRSLSTSIATKIFFSQRPSVCYVLHRTCTAFTMNRKSDHSRPYKILGSTGTVSYCHLLQALTVFAPSTFIQIFVFENDLNTCCMAVDVPNYNIWRQKYLRVIYLNLQRFLDLPLGHNASNFLLILLISTASFSGIALQTFAERLCQFQTLLIFSQIGDGIYVTINISYITTDNGLQVHIVGHHLR